VSDAVEIADVFARAGLAEGDPDRRYSLAMRAMSGGLALDDARFLVRRALGRCNGDSDRAGGLLAHWLEDSSRWKDVLAVREQAKLPLDQVLGELSGELEGGAPSSAEHPIVQDKRGQPIDALNRPLCVHLRLGSEWCADCAGYGTAATLQAQRERDRERAVAEMEKAPKSRGAQAKALGRALVAPPEDDEELVF